MKNVEEELRELAEPALAKDPSERTYKDRYLIWQYQDYLKEGVLMIMMKEKKLRYTMEKLYLKGK